MQNVKFVNQFGEGWTTHCRLSPGKWQIDRDRIVRELRDLITEEPHLGWKVEARGEFTQWHDWQEVNDSANEIVRVMSEQVE